MKRELTVVQNQSYDLYLPGGNAGLPLVVITPLLGRIVFLDDLFLERYLARFFSKNGIATAVIKRPIFDYAQGNGIQQIAGYIKNSVSRLNQVLDDIASRGIIDPEKIGTFGMSFGAVVNSIWAASHNRSKADILVLPGANLAEIFLTSRDPLMKSYRDGALADCGRDPVQLKTKLEGIFGEWEPLSLSYRTDIAAKTLLVLAIFDRVIAFPLGLKLRRKLLNPKTIFLPLGHYSAIAALPFLKWTVLNFYRKRFELTAGRK